MATYDDTIAEMHAFLPTPSKDAIDQVRGLSRRHIESTLRTVKVPDGVIDDVTAGWEAFRADEAWVSLLASLVEWVEWCRGDVDVPIPIWDDLDGAGASGRYFYFYLFAICYDATCAFLLNDGCPSDVLESTMTVMPRHVQTHQRKWGTVGFDPGWWLLPILRGEMVQVGSLQFHRVNLLIGNLSPEPWYSKDESLSYGAGFRRGDPSVGLHIPRGAALGPKDLDYTFARAREVLGSMWPVDQRRLATCQSWLLDAQLTEFLDPSSNIVQFQRRFTLLDGWYETDDGTLDFIFQSPNVARGDLPRTTSLQRGVLDLLDHGGHWRARPGWLDFDGV
jgi:GNAT domain-containint protein/N-acyltransferase family protein